MTIKHIKPNPDTISGFWEILDNPKLLSDNSAVIFNSDSILSVIDVLSDDSCNALLSMFFDSNIHEPVSVNGLKGENIGIGSVRATGWSIPLAEQLTELIIPFLPVLNCSDYTATDWWQNGFCRKWKPVSVSPLLRFMRYDTDSEHYAHYDAGYLYPDNIHRTLKSLVIYLTTNKIGATRFINDNQHLIPVFERNHLDWNRRVNENEIVLESFPVKGKVLVFDHRLCHDVEQYTKSESEDCRVIIRGDIIYERMED